MRRPHVAVRPLLVALALVVPLLAVGAAGVVVPSPAGAAASSGPRDVVSRDVVFDLGNVTGGDLLCAADGSDVRIRGRLIGRPKVVEGTGKSPTIDVLVHDAGTGGWFWNLRGQGRYDYATHLARQGRTVLVLDRLGYDRSPLADGGATCLGAQANLVHQVVQALYAGVYRGAGEGPNSKVPHASHTVLHGHGTGATIAQIAAARHGDVRGVVLLSPETTSTTSLAGDVLRGQAATCVGDDYAAFGTASEYRRLLFASAPQAVRSAAVTHRNPTPCGDVGSRASALLAAGLTSRTVEVPVLVLRGSEDARTSGWGGVESDVKVVRRTVQGAGNALVLEKQAPQVRRLVLDFVTSLPRKR